MLSLLTWNTYLLQLCEALHKFEDTLCYFIICPHLLRPTSVSDAEGNCFLALTLIHTSSHFRLLVSLLRPFNDCKLLLLLRSLFSVEEHFCLYFSKFGPVQLCWLWCGCGGVILSYLCEEGAVSHPWAGWRMLLLLGLRGEARKDCEWFCPKHTEILVGAGVWHTAAQQSWSSCWYTIISWLALLAMRC